MELTVNVDPEVIREKVQEYRERFQGAYDAMLKAYELAAEKYYAEHREWMSKVLAKTLPRDAEEPNQPRKPTNRTVSYDLILAMIDAHVTITTKPLELDMDAFDRLVNDNWSWRHQLHNELLYWSDYDFSPVSGWSTSTSTTTSTLSALSFAADSYESD